MFLPKAGKNSSKMNDVVDLVVFNELLVTRLIYNIQLFIPALNSVILFNQVCGDNLISTHFLDEGVSKCFSDLSSAASN
jgi:hypothetical protein